MSMEIILAAVIVGGTGLLLGLFLGLAGKKFAVEIDEKEQQVREQLPGNNCGGCGYAGCDAMAKAIANGEAPVNGCPVGGDAVAAKIARIMGQEAGESIRRVAFVKCGGTCDKAKESCHYYGVHDCEMMDFIPGGGPKTCHYGCIGDGTCEKVCSFDAIHVINGVAVVDKEKCRACGACVEHCPRHLIELVPYESRYLVRCASKDKGKLVMQACEAGCIGCKKCQRECPSGAVTVENNIAHIDTSKCTNCGKCASCRNGRVNACEHNETLGVQRNGSMQEFLVLPWTKVIPATGLSDMECALIEPMSVGFHAVSRAQVTDIDTVAVIGCGMIGLGAIVRASLRGARVIAMDIDDEKLELAKRLGASMVINSKTENVVERVRELTDGYMADVVIEAVGSPVTYVTAIDIVAFTGRVACIGYAKSEVAFQTKYFVQKELDIRGSRNAMPEDFRAVIHYLQNGNCPMNELISAVVKPEEAGEALQKWSENPGKVFRMLVEF